MNDNAAYTQERLELQRQNLRTVVSAGIRVVLGTDTGFFGVVVGAATRVELELMVEAGLSPLTALRAATSNAALMIDEDDDFGAIEPGQRADFLILDENPLEDVTNASTLYRVVKGGRVLDPSDQR